MIALLIYPFSYETLPSNFSLADNMLAGAFAGIAVSFQPPASHPSIVGLILIS